MPLTPPPVDLPALIRTYDWPAETAILIVFGPTARCPWGESGGEDVVSPDGLYFGPFQLSREKAATVEELLDVPTNVGLAYRTYLEAGRSFSPWGCNPDA